jgi:SAM-dependent methyltransferase
LSAFYSGDTYPCHDATGSASAGAKADFILERIAEYLPPEGPRTALDYGAGGGGFLSHIRNRGWKVRGFEPGKRGLESCRQAGLEVTDKLEDLSPGDFGLVTLHHVFEHLPNPTKVLDGVRRLLARDGRLYIEVPNARSLRARLAIPFLSRRFRIDERYRAYPIHLMYYSDRTLRAMLGKAGWTVEMTFTIGLGLGEFFIYPESTHKGTTRAGETGRVLPPPKRRLRYILRDAFLSLGIGENLAAIAYPNRS